MSTAASHLFRLDGHTAVVVGAGSGIGRAVAVGLADHGASVTCLDLDGAASADTATTITDAGGRARSGKVDIVDAGAVDAAFEELVAREGGVDVAVCTPGVNVRKPLLDYTDGEFDRVVDTNLKGNLHVLQAAGRRMADRGRGSIVLFSSIRSLVVEPGQGVYAATKAGIVQMVRTLAAELGPRGVRVNAVAPGVVDTPLTRPIKARPDWYEAYARRNALGRWAAAEEMVGPAVFLASPAASYVTGTVLFADGGWTAVDGRFTPPI